MADKSTKTDDILLNGDALALGPTLRPETIAASTSVSKTSSTNVGTSAVKQVPTTTNAATMTSAVVVTDVTTSTNTATTPAPTNLPTVESTVCMVSYALFCNNLYFH